MDNYGTMAETRASQYQIASSGPDSSSPGTNINMNVAVEDIVDVAAKRPERFNFRAWRKQKFNVGVVGNAGTGKSSLINALFGRKPEDSGAAPVGLFSESGCPTWYKPKDSEVNLRIWDLPDIGESSQDTYAYFDDIDFPIFNYFIIVGHTRFTENEIWLASQIKRFGKDFCIVRTKFDEDIENEKRSHSKTDEIQLGQQIIDNCRGNLERRSVRSDDTRIFLVDSFHTYKHDFKALMMCIIDEMKKSKSLLRESHCSLKYHCFRFCVKCCR